MDPKHFPHSGGFIMGSTFKLVGHQEGNEASVLPVYKEMPDYRKAIHFMNEIGFELSGLFPVARDEKWRLIEFDYVMVNAEKIDLIPAETH